MAHDNLVQAFSIAVGKELIPGASTFAEVVDHIHQKKQEKARIILFRELSAGTAVDGLIEAANDDALELIHRYFSSCSKGAQARNLKMLARAIRKSAEQENIDPDAFDQLAARVEFLTAQEIQLIGALYRHRGQGGNVWDKAAEELIPVPFPDKQTMEAVGMMATRSSMILDRHALEVTSYEISPIGIAICDMLGDTFQAD